MKKRDSGKTSQTSGSSSTEPFVQPTHPTSVARLLHFPAKERKLEQERKRLRRLNYYSQRKSESKDYRDELSPYGFDQRMKYIHAHLDPELGLAEFAAIAHLSSHYFMRLFKQLTGMTPHQFVIQIDWNDPASVCDSVRVKRAKALLLAGKDSITEVAQEVGFANQAHLTVHW